VKPGIFIVIAVLIFASLAVSSEKPATENQYVKFSAALKQPSMAKGSTGALLINLRPQKGIHIVLEPPVSVTFDSAAPVEISGKVEVPKCQSSPTSTRESDRAAVQARERCPRVDRNREGNPDIFLLLGCGRVVQQVQAALRGHRHGHEVSADGKVYFISDAHLGLGSREEEREKERRLIAFLDVMRRDANQLFIVGDLFDAWFEYRTVIMRGFHRLLAKLDECTEQGIAIHYLAGNHDYWMKDFFSDELRMKTYHKRSKRSSTEEGFHPSWRRAGEQRCRLSDSQENFEQPAQYLALFLGPSDIGIKIARSSSRKSRHYTSARTTVNRTEC